MPSLKKNIAFNITYQILILFLPLVTSSYLGRIIGAEGIGIYSYYYSIALYFTYFTVLGLNKYGNRCIASAKNEKKCLSKVFCSIYSIQVICFGVSFTVYILCSLFVFADTYIPLVFGLFVLSSLFDINWFFFGMEMFDKTVIRNTIIKLSTTALIFCFVKSRDDIYVYVFIMSIGYLLSQIALWPYVRKYIDYQKVKITDLKPHWKGNLYLFLPVIAVSIYRILDKIMLGLFSTKTDVGLFENAEKIINVPIVVVAALGTVMLPHVTNLLSLKREKEARQYMDLSIFIVTAFSVCSMFMIWGTSSIVSVLLWGKEFAPSGVIMNLLGITLIFLSIGDVARSQYLIPYKYDKVYIKSAFIGAAINIIVNILLIPRYGYIGASIGTIMAEASVCIYQLFKIRKHLPILKYLKNLAICGSVGMCMFSTMSICGDSNSILHLVIRVFIGMFVYASLIFIFFHKTIKLVFHQIKK